MKISNPFKTLNKTELVLWMISLALVIVSFLIPKQKDYLTLIASLIGVTALIFVAKGYVFGQILTVVFAVFYGIISWHFRYYGEMITYLCMTAPIAVMAVVSWLRHPYKKSKEVEVSSVSKKQLAVMLGLSVLVTVALYFILRALDTANLIVSTISVTTSFLAVYLTYLRSPYYALAYSANDIVLIILWVLAGITNPAYYPVVICFVAFLLNDVYGFINWQRMKKRQQTNS